MQEQMLREGPAAAEGDLGCPHLGGRSPQGPPPAGRARGQRLWGCRGSDPTIRPLRIAPGLSISLGVVPSPKRRSHPAPVLPVLGRNPQAAAQPRAALREQQPESGGLGLFARGEQQPVSWEQEEQRRVQPGLVRCIFPAADVPDCSWEWCWGCLGGNFSGLNAFFQSWLSLWACSPACKQTVALAVHSSVAQGCSAAGNMHKYSPCPCKAARLNLSHSRRCHLP